MDIASGGLHKIEYLRRKSVYAAVISLRDVMMCPNHASQHNLFIYYLPVDCSDDVFLVCREVMLMCPIQDRVKFKFY